MITPVAELFVCEDCPHRECHFGPVRPHFPGTSQLGQKARVLGVQQLHCFQAPVKRLFNLLFHLQTSQHSVQQSSIHC